MWFCHKFEALFILDLKTIKFLLASFSQTIENELRKFEVQQSNEQVKMLHSFMPESFLRRGGEEKCTSILCKTICLVYEIVCLCNNT